MPTFIGAGSQVSEFCIIDESKRGTSTRIGLNCQIDDFVRIKHVGGDGNIEIGDEVYINSGCVLYSGNGIKIGSKVLIGPNSNIVPVNHEFSRIDVPILSQKFQISKGGVVIEDDVWIGANVTILDGSIIRRGCVVAAGSVVSKEFPPYSVIAGIPAKIIKMRNDT